jgi:cytochrome P450
MFEPSRFLPGAPQPARLAYMPFGIGRHTCIGAQFALAEWVLALATMDRASRIEIAEPRAANPVGIVNPTTRLLFCCSGGKIRLQPHRFNCSQQCLCR